MGIDGVSPAAIVIPALNVAYRTGKTAFELASVGDQARQLLGTIDQVLSDLDHARRLRKWKSKAMDIHEKTKVDETIKSTEQAVRRVQELVESARIDISTNWGKLSTKTRVMWVLDSSNKVGTTLALLNAHNTTLNREITLMSLKDGGPVEEEDDDEVQAPAQALRRKSTVVGRRATVVRHAHVQEPTEPPPSYQQATRDMLHKRRQSYRRQSAWLGRSGAATEGTTPSTTEVNTTRATSPVVAPPTQTLGLGEIVARLGDTGSSSSSETSSNHAEDEAQQTKDEESSPPLGATLRDFRHFVDQNTKMISPMIEQARKTSAATRETPTPPPSGPAHAAPPGSSTKTPGPSPSASPSPPSSPPPNASSSSTSDTRPLQPLRRPQVPLKPKLFNVPLFPRDSVQVALQAPRHPPPPPPPPPALSAISLSRPPSNPFADDYEIPDPALQRPLSPQVTGGGVPMSSEANISGHAQPMRLEWIETHAQGDAGRVGRAYNRSQAASPDPSLLPDVHRRDFVQGQDQSQGQYNTQNQGQNQYQAQYQRAAARRRSWHPRTSALSDSAGDISALAGAVATTVPMRPTIPRGLSSTHTSTTSIAGPAGFVPGVPLNGRSTRGRGWLKWQAARAETAVDEHPGGASAALVAI